MNNLKLRTKLYFSHLVVLVLPLIIIGFLFVKNTNDNNKLIREADQLSTSSNLLVLVQRVNDFKKSNIRDFQFFTNIPAVQGIVRARASKGIDVVTGSTINQWQSRFTQASISLLKEKKYFQEIAFLDEDNSEIVKVIQTEGGPLKVDFDDLLEEREDKYLSSIIEGNKESHITTDIVLQREEGEIVEGNIPIYKIAKNIFDSNGERVGIISFSIYCDYFLDWFSSSDNENLYLINSTGHFAAHPNLNKRWGHELEKRKDFNVKNLTNTKLINIVKDSKIEVTPLDSKINLIKGVVNFDDNDKTKSWLIISEKNKKEVISALNIFIMISAVSVVLSLVLITLFTRAIVGPITKIIDNLHSSSGNTNDVSKEILTVSNELTDVSTRLATGTQQTMATLDEISAIVERTSENASQSSVNTAECSKIAKDGEKTMGRLKDSIDQISEGNTDIVNQIESSNEEMSEIEKIIEEINIKTKVINDIVFQTKLLSFNASVEAARAGADGAGFAVVAEEIGSLAKMSGNASSEIEKMLNTSITKVRDIVKKSKESTDKIVGSNKVNIESGHQVVTDCTIVFENIVKRIEEIKTQISEVSSSAKEQIEGIENISGAMTVIDTASMSANESAGNASNLSTSLGEEVESLENMVISLQTQVFGGKSDLVQNQETEIKIADNELDEELDNIIDFKDSLEVEEAESNHDAKNKIESNKEEIEKKVDNV